VIPIGTLLKGICSPTKVPFMVMEHIKIKRQTGRNVQIVDGYRLARTDRINERFTIAKDSLAQRFEVIE
jgi:hypothetical protein